MKISDYSVLLDDETTMLLLNYIRKNIHKKYPFRSLSSSHILNDIHLDRELINVEYLTAGKGSQKMIPYKSDVIYHIYYKNDYIGTADWIFKMKLYKSKDKYFKKAKGEQSKRINGMMSHKR